MLAKSLAWAVHVFTSLGMLAAFLALIAIDQGEWRQSFIWLFICFVIDSVDGTLARRCRAAEVLPSIDGKSIDFVIDFATYALIPAFFFYKAQMVSEALMPIAILIILMSSTLYYGKKDMVQDEQYFIGFPVLWNFVVFYQFFIFENNQLLNFCSVAIIGILHFVPLKFAYPSRSTKNFYSHLVMTLLGIISSGTVLYLYPENNPTFSMLSVIAVGYFSIFALFDTLKNQIN